MSIWAKEYTLDYSLKLMFSPNFPNFLLSIIALLPISKSRWAYFQGRAKTHSPGVAWMTKISLRPKMPVAHLLSFLHQPSQNRCILLVELSLRTILKMGILSRYLRFPRPRVCHNFPDQFRADNSSGPAISTRRKHANHGNRLFSIS